MALFKSLFRSFSGYSYRQAIIRSQTKNSNLLTNFNLRFDNKHIRSYSWVAKRITFFLKTIDGALLKKEGKIGDRLFDAIQGDPDFNGYGECQGLQACTTCHVIFTKEDFRTMSKYKSENEEAENDLLDDIVNKFPDSDVEFRTETSRLGCCFRLVPEMEGMVIKIPKSRSVVDT